MLRSLPQTLCHGDANQDSLYFRPTGDGLTAIDWHFCGVGAVGREIGQLFVYALKSYRFPGERAADLDEAVFAGYLDGLRAAGWTGDERHARLGYLIGLVAMQAMRVPQLGMLGDQSRHAAIERRHGMAMIEVARHHAAITHYLLGLADEARALIATATPA